MRQAREQGVAAGGAVDEAARLVVDGEREIDPLHVVVGPDLALRVRWHDAVDVADAVEVLERGGHLAVPRARLESAVAGRARSVRELERVALLELVE